MTRGQLLELVPRSTINGWISGDRLHPVFAGVYRVGHELALPHSRELAAVLACGPGALLSHRSAAELRELIEPRHGFVPQVTVDRKIAGPRGVRVHQTDSMRGIADEVRGVPVTSAVRTVIDFASQASQREVATAYEECLIRGLFTREQMIIALMRYRGRRGIRKIRALVDRDAPPSVTYREAHRRLLELIRNSDLPHPLTEHWIGRHRVDILWPDERLVVEMDGLAFHSTPAKIEADKLRDAELASQGYLVIRVTWRQLTREPRAVIDRIAATLAQRAPRSVPTKP